MSLLSYTELLDLIKQGVINAPVGNVNSSSIDLTLDEEIMLEKTRTSRLIDLSNKESIQMIPLKMPSRGHVMMPGEFILASSVEVFNLPDNISAEYKLKSSMARNGLEHLNAGWCDAGWHGSKLTLELKNMTRHHTLLIKPGMKIGQVVFFKHEPVPDHASYASRGQYNKQTKVQASKGIR